MRKTKNKIKLTDSINKLLSKTASVTIKGKKYTVAPIKLGVFTALAVLLIWLFLSAVFSSGISNIDIGFEAGSAYRTVKADDTVVLYNNRGAKGVSESGRVKWEIHEEMSEPMVETAGSYVLIVDLAGNHRAVSYKNGEIFRQYSLGNDIISAKITKKGCAAFVTDTDGYKAKVTVFNKRGREVYAWNSGTGYITDIELSNNGRYLVAAQLITEGDTTDTRYQFIDTSRGEVIKTVEHKNEVCAELRFISSDRLIAVGDNNISAFSKTGRERFTLSLAGKSPSIYDIGEKCIAVATVDGRGNTVLELYSVSGKLRGSYTATGEIRTRSTDGSRSGACRAERNCESWCIRQS